MTPWRAYVTEAKFEFVRALRAPAFAVPIFVLPAALYIFFGTVLPMPNRPPQIDVLIFTGFAVMGVMGPGLFGFGVFVAIEREQGLLKLKRALPMPPSAYILAKMFMTMLVALLVTVMLITAGLVTRKVVLTPAQGAALAAVLVG